MLTWLAYNALAALPFVLGALVLERLGRRRPSLVHLAWVLVLVRLVVPPGVGLGSAAGVVAQEPVVLQSGSLSLQREVAGWLTRTFGPSWSVPLERGFLVVTLLLGAWCLGRQLRALWIVRRRLRAAAAPPTPLVESARRIAQRIGVPLPRMRVLSGVPSPFVMSVGRGVLVLPETSRSEDRTVLAHELAHLRRRDHWIGYLELAALLLHWWNPVFWWARRRLHVTRERACDAWVVQHFPEERHAYAHALVEAAERGARDHELARVLPAFGHPDESARELETRLRCILHGEDAARVPRAAAFTAFALLALSLPGVALPSLAQFRASLPAIPEGPSQARWQQLLEASEATLAETPDDERARDLRAMSLLAVGRFEQALQAWLEIAERSPTDPRPPYNLTCTLTLLGRNDEALDQLERAVELGFDRPDILAADPDLEELRDEQRFRALMERVATNGTQAPPHAPSRGR